MKNKEKNRDEILKPTGNWCDNFVKPKILKPYGIECNAFLSCKQCRLIQAMWLEEEYQEPKKPEVDWNKVEVDTKVLVSNNGRTWYKKYFAEYKDGKVYTWMGGTSWNCSFQDKVVWNCAKLVEEE